MKKFLSLVLALVMTMSLVTVSAGAKDFGDSADLSGEAYEEAVNVMSEMGIIDGYSDGDFRPQGTLTRQAAAKIIACMMLGKTTAESLGTQAAPFKDVPVGSTFAGYIAYCVESGLIDGYADGTFRPQGTLTGFAFLKMLLTALGYDSAIEGYTGPNWTVNVMGRATQIGLTDGNDEFVGNRAATREEACLYAVNALQATLVEYADKGQEITVNGTVITTRPSVPTYITSSIAGAATSIDDTKDNTQNDYTVEFAERYQPDLELDRTIDVFGRPAHTWTWKGDEVGTYVDYDKLVVEYTTEVSGKDLYDELGKSTVEDYDFTITIDGETESKVLGDAYFTVKDLNKNNKDGVGATGDGVLTQVFEDTASKDVYIAVINTYLAKATDDYDEKKDEATFDVYGLDKVSNTYVKTLTKNEDKESFDVSAEDIALAADVVENEVYLVTVADGEVQTLAKAEVVSDSEITAFKLGTSVTADGTKYNYADTAEYDVEVLDQYTDNKVNLKDLTYNVYLDEYGYLIGVDLVETPNNYVFITGIDTAYSNLSNKTLDASAIFIDGSMDVIEVKADKGDVPEASNDALVNSWCTYTVDKNGVYTLTEVASKISDDDDVAQYADTTYTKTIDKKNISLPGGGAADYNKVYGNDATVYLTASIKEIMTGSNRSDIIIDGVDSVTTGIKNANITPWNEDGARKDAEGDIRTSKASGVASGVYTLYKENGYIIAAVVVGEDAAASKNLVYAHTSDVEMESYDKTSDEWTWTRKVISDGQEVEIKEVGDALTYLDTMDQYNWYQVKYNADNEVMNVEPASKALTLNADYVTNIVNLEAAINGKEDTVLYTQTFPKDQPEMKGSTLFVTTKSTQGFFVAEDVNITLIQIVKNKQETSFETGVDELENIIDDLNEKNGTFNYQISAILEDGAATSVVIYDMTNTYDRPSNPVETDDYNVELVNGSYEIDYHTKAANDDDTMLDLIVNDLVARGYDAREIEISQRNGIYNITATNGRVSRTFTWDPAEGKGKFESLFVELDGTVYLVRDNTVVSDIADLKKGDAVLVTEADGDSYIFPADGALRIADDGCVIESGYDQSDAVAEDSKALNDAIAAGADTVYLGDGEYTIDNAISDDLTIIGNGDTVITGKGRTITVSDGNLTIKNATVKTEDGQYGIMSTKGASGELVLDGVIFEGGKIAVMLDSMNGATIENCTFINTEKAAISIGDSFAGTATISDNTYNVGGDAVAIEYVESAKIAGSDIRDLADNMISVLE